MEGYGFESAQAIFVHTPYAELRQWLIYLTLVLIEASETFNAQTFLKYWAHNFLTRLFKDRTLQDNFEQQCVCAPFNQLADLN